jgi:hypothetical protein
MSNEKLIDAVIGQIEKDLAGGETMALAELLDYIPKNCLIGFLPEEKWSEFNA